MTTSREIEAIGIVGTDRSGGRSQGLWGAPKTAINPQWWPVLRQIGGGVERGVSKLLCHNLCRLVASTHELGITATFWGDEAGTAEAEPETVPAFGLAPEESIEMFG